MPTQPETISGRIRTNPPLSADPGRYQFLDLPNAEPNLSLPVKTSSEGVKSFLLSDALLGTRYWSTSAQISLSGNNIGIGTDKPNVQGLTVKGSISASDFIFGTFFDPVIPAAAGSPQQVQFNQAGFLGADRGFIYQRSLSSLVVGDDNTSTGDQSSIAGGTGNASSGNSSFIGGGNNNSTSGAANAIVTGELNSASGDYTFVGGGRNNTAENTYAVTTGGDDNDNEGYGAFIGSGQNNTIQSGTQFNGIIGGQNNVVNHNNSFVLGSNLTTLSADTTYVENIQVTKHAILDASIAEGFTTVYPSTNVISINLNNGTTHNVMLTADVNSFNVQNYVNGKVNSFIMFIKQDISGTRNVTWTFNGLTLKWPNGGSVPSITQSPNAIDIFTFITDGSNTWYGFSGSQNYV
jgi:hypothetical protein